MNKFEEILIEVAAFTPCSALNAASAGAHRIELCSGYSEGGLAPSAASIQYVREIVDIPVHVMLRPRIGDFVYNDIEKEIIIKDVLFCKENHIDGIVVGVLTKNGMPDKSFTQKILELAYPMKVTFHRAFDLCPDIFEALEILKGCGVHRILTSGGQASAPAAIPLIAELIKRAGNDLIILPGGGINPSNVKELILKTGAKEIHFSGKSLLTSPMKPHPKVNLCSEGEVDDYNWFESDSMKISEMTNTLS